MMIKVVDAVLMMPKEKELLFTKKSGCKKAMLSSHECSS